MSACIFRETDADRDPVVAVQLARWMFSWRTTPVSERRAVILSDNTHLVGTACAVTGRTLVNVDMRLFRVNDDLELRTWEAVGRVLMLVGLDMRVCSPSRDSALYLVSRVPLPIVCICDSPESLGEDRLIERLCMRLPFASSSQSAGSPAACSFAPNKVTTGCIGDPRLVWQLMHWLEVWNTVAERRSILITGDACTGKSTSAGMVCDLAHYNSVTLRARDVRSLDDLTSWYVGGDRFVMVLKELDMRPGSESYDAVAKLLRDPPFPVVCISNAEPAGESADFFARYCAHLRSRSD